MLVYIYFNMRALNRTTALPSASDWDRFLEYLESLPPLTENEEESIQQVYAKAIEEKERKGKLLIPGSQLG